MTGVASKARSYKIHGASDCSFSWVAHAGEAGRHVVRTLSIPVERPQGGKNLRPPANSQH